MLGPHAFFGWVLDPKTVAYSETLAQGPHALYPLDFSGRRQSGGLVWDIETWEAKVFPCLPQDSPGGSDMGVSTSKSARTEP
jgi:hypothetical protein